MVFSPPDAADVWQHRKDFENAALRKTTSSRPKRSSESQRPIKDDPQLSTSQAPDKGKTIPSQGGDDMAEEGEASGSGQEGKGKSTMPRRLDRSNIWAGRNKDGQDRSHIPPMSMAMLGLRIAQLSLAVIFLVLASFSAFTLNMGNVSKP
jgi:hypothetical protein